MAEGLDASSGTSLSMSGWTGPHFSAAHPSNAYSSPHLQLPTPDSSPRLYPYYPHPCNPPVSTSQLAPPLPRCEISFVCGSSLDESPISSPGIWRGTLCSLLQLRLLEISEQLCASWDSATGRPPHCPFWNCRPDQFRIQAVLVKTMRVPTTVTELCNKFPMESKCLKVSSYLLSLTLSL